jgi:hypothetical protein
VALRKHWTRGRGRRRVLGPALGLAAALAIVGCTSVLPGPGAASVRGSTAGTAAPAITAAQARQVWDHYVAAGAEAVKTGNPALALALETGPQRAYDSATDTAARKTLGTGASALRQARAGLAPPAYTTPAFSLPEQSGYPRFFVADATRKLTSDYSSGAAAPISVDGAAIRPFVPELLLFEQASAGKPWLLASTSNLAVGETLPKLAADNAGYARTVAPTAGTQLAQPDYVGALQAAVVDDGPANAATKAVADGPLTTGLYQGTVDHAGDLTAPPGDVYQWELDGSSYPQFALHTAAGGALVFYAMTLTTTVAVPDVINKANPIHSGPPIQVPADLRPLLPPGQPAPLVQLSSDQTLSFAAVDPAPGAAKVQVIAMGGGLTSASAS